MNGENTSSAPRARANARNRGHWIVAPLDAGFGDRDAGTGFAIRVAAAESLAKPVCSGAMAPSFAPADGSEARS